MISIDDQAPELEEEWLMEDKLKDKKRHQQQYKRNQAIPMIRQQRQQDPENEDEVPIQPDEENESDNDDNNDGDYWQP